MTPFHIFLAVIIGLLWGFNFVVMKVGLNEIPPFLFAALRFLFVSIPVVFFVKRPPISWALLSGIGFTFGFLKFAFLFSSLAFGASAGLASLLAQLQIGFSVLFAYLLLKTKISPRQIIGLFISGLGVVLISCQHDSLDSSLLGIICVIASAFMWGISNVLTKMAGPVNSFALIVWVSLFAVIPHFTLSFIFEGKDAIFTSLTSLTWQSYGAVAYIVVLASWLGGTLWCHLIKIYTPSQVAPYSLLIPVFGILSGWLFLDEALSFNMMLASIIVFSGLAINQWPKKNPAIHLMGKTA